MPHSLDDALGEPQPPARCPLTELQLQAFDLAARGLSNVEIAQRMDCTVVAVQNLHAKGYRHLGVQCLRDALERLIEDGWLTGDAAMPPAAFRYMRAFDAYLAAPPHERDQMLIRDLCNDALEELLSKPKRESEGRSDGS